VQFSQAATYSVSVENEFGLAQSADSSVIVVRPPVDLTVKAGSEVTVTAVISLPPAPFAVYYQWLLGGNVLATATNASSGARTVFTNNMVLNPDTYGQGGTYSYRLANQQGTLAAYSATLKIESTSLIPPTLVIELRPPNVIMSWPDSQVAWTLEETTDLTAMGNWSDLAIAPILTNGRWQVAVPLASHTTTYFRVKHTAPLRGF